MKATQSKEFKPVTLTLETQEEVDKIFILLDDFNIRAVFDFNTTPNPLRGFESTLVSEYEKYLRCIICP